MVEFSETQIKKSKGARDIYAIPCYPTVKDFINMIRGNMLMKCPVTVEDMNNPVKSFDQIFMIFR